MSREITKIEAKALPSAPVVGLSLIEQAKVVANTGLVPDYLRGKPDWVLAIGLKGRELGFGLMTSMDYLHYIKGKVGLAAQAMLGLAMSKLPGADIQVSSDDGHTCTIKGRRSQEHSWVEASYSMDEAKAAGITGNPSWKKYPKDMLWARAVSRLCRRLFPDVLLGLYTPEELGAEVDAEGTPVLTAADAAMPNDPAPEPTPDTTDWNAKLEEIRGKMEAAGVSQSVIGDVFVGLAKMHAGDHQLSEMHHALTNESDGLRKFLTPARKGHWDGVCVLWLEYQRGEHTPRQFNEGLEALQQEI